MIAAISLTPVTHSHTDHVKSTVFFTSKHHCLIILWWRQNDGKMSSEDETLSFDRNQKNPDETKSIYGSRTKYQIENFKAKNKKQEYLK